MKNIKKGFTLAELIVVMFIVVISAVGTQSLFTSLKEDKLSNFGLSIYNRFNTLYKSTLVQKNFYYSNSGVTIPTHIKLYCDNEEKTFLAYICDNTNNIPIAGNTNGCKQIDFPTPQTFKSDDGTYLGIGNSSIKINSCQYKNGATWVNQSFYITISTIYPYGLINTYIESSPKTKTNILDDTIYNKKDVRTLIQNGSNTYNYVNLLNF